GGLSPAFKTKGGRDGHHASSIRRKRRKSARSARGASGTSSGRARRTGDQAFALGALARQPAGTPDRLGRFAGSRFGRLFVVAAHLHLAENAFALHLLLERAERLVNIVVANEYLHGRSCVSSLR